MHNDIIWSEHGKPAVMAVIKVDQEDGKEVDRVLVKSWSEISWPCRCKYYLDPDMLLHIGTLFNESMEKFTACIHYAIRSFHFENGGQDHP